MIDCFGLFFLFLFRIMLIGWYFTTPPLGFQYIFYILIIRTIIPVQIIHCRIKHFKDLYVKRGNISLAHTYINRNTHITWKEFTHVKVSPASLQKDNYLKQHNGIYKQYMMWSIKNLATSYPFTFANSLCTFVSCMICSLLKYLFVEL